MMMVFGVFGYLIRKGRFPAAPLVLAMILGPILERSVQQSLMISGGDFLIFLQRPISLGMLLAAGLLMLSPAARRLWSRRRA
jgi:putative tricarboxylic transport membrane protein